MSDDIVLDTVENLLQKLEHRDKIIAAQRKVIEQLKEELKHEGRNAKRDTGNDGSFEAGGATGLAVSPDAWRGVQD